MTPIRALSCSSLLDTLVIPFIYIIPITSVLFLEETYSIAYAHSITLHFLLIFPRIPLNLLSITTHIPFPLSLSTSTLHSTFLSSPLLTQQRIRSFSFTSHLTAFFPPPPPPPKILPLKQQHSTLKQTETFQPFLSRARSAINHSHNQRTRPLILGHHTQRILPIHWKFHILSSFHFSHFINEERGCKGNLKWCGKIKRRPRDTGARQSFGGGCVAWVVPRSPLYLYEWCEVALRWGGEVEW